MARFRRVFVLSAFGVHMGSKRLSVSRGLSRFFFGDVGLTFSLGSQAELLITQQGSAVLRSVPQDGDF